jgi:hypothetical protein
MALAVRSDRLWASYGKQQQEIALLEEEEGVAAIRGQESSDRWTNQKKKKTGQQKNCQEDQLWPGVL